MPELPEVETVRRVLSERLAGRVISEVKVGAPTFYRPIPRSALDAMKGAEIAGFGRRGKYLLLRLRGGAEVVFHLGMSGRLSLNGDRDHIRFELVAGGERLKFHDSRRFGRVGCSLPPKMGPEPLEEGFDAAYLKKAFRGRTAPVKALLMDQGVVAGVGNIYATEALFLAKIRPGRAAGRLKAAEVEALCAAVKKVLGRAVELRGSTLDDEAYLDPLGNPGRAQNETAVYGRKTGRCGHALKATRKMIAGRTSLFCPECQR